MSKTIKIPNISMWEENDSEKVKYVVTYILHDIKELERKNELLNINVEDLQNKIDKIKDVYTSMQFASPENMYIFIEKLGNILEGE